MQESAFAVAIFPVEFVILERIGRKPGQRIASGGDFEAASLIPA
jgi:hypothetical protein